MMALGLGIGLTFSPSTSGGSAPVAPGAVATTYPTTPTALFHPNTATMTNFSDLPAQVGDRVKTMLDTTSTITATGSLVTNAPILSVDALGVKYLDFIDGAYMVAGLTGLSAQSVSYFMAVQAHKCRTYNFLYPRYQSDGITANSANLGALRTANPTGGTVPFLASGGNSQSSSADTTNRRYMLAGSQLQIIGFASRVTASGGIRYFHNERVADAAQTTARTGMIGLVIGASPTLAQTVDTGMNLYELAVVTSGLLNTPAQAMQDAAIANWQPGTVTDQLLLPGDSITDGIAVRSDGLGNVRSSESLGAQLCKRGASLVSSGTRVLNIGASGNTVGDLVLARDGTISPFDQLLGTNEPAKNKLAVQIGRNNWGSGGQTGAQSYAEIVALLNTTTTGYLQRGWTCTAVCNIANLGATQTKVEDQRALFFSSLLADTLAGPGQTFDGRVNILSLHLAQYASATRFEDAADANDITYYQPSSTNPLNSDGTHPNPLGTQIMATGGTTPQYGYGSLA